MEPQLLLFTAAGCLTYASDHRYGTLPVDHGTKLPETWEAEDCGHLAPVDRNEGESRGDLDVPAKNLL